MSETPSNLKHEHVPNSSTRYPHNVGIDFAIQGLMAFWNFSCGPENLPVGGVHNKVFFLRSKVLILTEVQVIQLAILSMNMILYHHYSYSFVISTSIIYPKTRF